MANQAIAGTLNQDTKLKPTVVFEGCFDYSSDAQTPPAAPVAKLLCLSSFKWGQFTVCFRICVNPACWYENRELCWTKLISAEHILGYCFCCYGFLIFCWNNQTYFPVTKVSLQCTVIPKNRYVKVFDWHTSLGRQDYIGRAKHSCRNGTHHDPPPIVSITDMNK